MTDDIDTLLQKLAGGDYYDRSRAARRLGDVRDARARDALVSALQDEDEWVIENATESLGRIGDASVLEHLMPLLDHNAYKVRTAAATALGALGDPEALPALRRYENDGDGWVREAVAGAIRAIESGGGAAAPAPAAPTPSAPHVDAAPRATGGAADEADPDTWVETVARDLAAQHKRLKDGSHLLRFVLRNGRHQKVRVVTTETGSGGRRRIRLLTIVAPARERVLPWALRQNMRLTRGALGLVRLGGRDLLTLTEAFYASDATGAVVRDAVQRIAERGDRLEEMLTEADAW